MKSSKKILEKKLDFQVLFTYIDYTVNNAVHTKTNFERTT